MTIFYVEESYSEYVGRLTYIYSYVCGANVRKVMYFTSLLCVL